MATHYGGLLSRHACLGGAAVAFTVTLMLTTRTGTTMMGEPSSLVHASPSSVPQRQLQAVAPEPPNSSIAVPPHMGMPVHAEATIISVTACQMALAPQAYSLGIDHMHGWSRHSETMAFQVSGAQDTNNVHDNVANGFLPRLSALQVRLRRLDATRYTSFHALLPPRAGRGRHQRPLL